MKKLLAVLSLSIFLCSSAQAQENNNHRRGGKYREQMKMRIKDELKLTDVQADSVIAAHIDFGEKLKQLHEDSNLTDEQKASQAKALNEERKVRLKKVLAEQQIAQVDKYFAELRKNRDWGGSKSASKEP